MLYLRPCFLTFCSLLFSLSALADNASIQLAQTYPGNLDISHYMVSEKLDGVRARWTGSTLLSRGGHRIFAPAWFTQNWPTEPMDGELWVARGQFSFTASIVLTQTPDERWQQVKMMIFDVPNRAEPFAQRVMIMQKLVEKSANPTLQMVPQFRLQDDNELQRKLDEVIRAGGEGLMIHHQDALYQSGRSSHLFKVKRYQDDEAQVIEHLPGKGKYEGKLGAIRVRMRDGREFKIGSGFSDHQRQHPPALGSWVTFKYYGLTKTGLPRFASFLHVRPKSDMQQ